MTLIMVANCLQSCLVLSCLRVVCVGVVWRAVLLCVVVVCVWVCVVLRRAGVQQLYQVFRMIKGNRQHVVLDLLPNFKMGKIQRVGELLWGKCNLHVGHFGERNWR